MDRSFWAQLSNNGDIIGLVSILWGLSSHRRSSSYVVEIRDWPVGHVLLFLLRSKDSSFQCSHTPIYFPPVRRSFFRSYSTGEGSSFDLWLHPSFLYRDNLDCITVIAIHRDRCYNRIDLRGVLSICVPCGTGPAH